MHCSKANHLQHSAKQIKKTIATTAIQQIKRKDGDRVLQEDKTRRLSWHPDGEKTFWTSVHIVFWKQEMIRHTAGTF